MATGEAARHPLPALRPDAPTNLVPELGNETATAGENQLYL